MRRALRRLVQSAGYPVETFASAHDYLNATPRARVGCLVLDIYMEGMNRPTTRERIRKSGAAGYLSKPFDPEALLDAIRRVSRAA
jgi:FixJ family two-component response regulator